MKKAQGLSLNTIIISALVIMVLVSLILLFTGRIGNFNLTESKECETNNNCSTDEVCLQNKCYFSERAKCFRIAKLDYNITATSCTYSNNCRCEGVKYLTKEQEITRNNSIEIIPSIEEKQVIQFHFKEEIVNYISNVTTYVYANNNLINKYTHIVEWEMNEQCMPIYSPNDLFIDLTNIKHFNNTPLSIGFEFNDIQKPNCFIGYENDIDSLHLIDEPAVTHQPLYEVGNCPFTVRNETLIKLDGTQTTYEVCEE